MQSVNESLQLVDVSSDDLARTGSQDGIDKSLHDKYVTERRRRKTEGNGIDG